MVNGVLYLATTNNVYAVDVRSGAEIWHFYWKSNGGTSGTRGVSMLGNTLFFQTGDEFVVAIDATTGKERWRKRVVSGPGYTNATTPLAVKNHVILAVGGDRQDIPAWVESRIRKPANSNGGGTSRRAKANPALKHGRTRKRRYTVAAAPGSHSPTMPS